MKKVLPSSELGGAPFFYDDMDTVFNKEIWDVIEGMFYGYSQDTEGIVIQGCVLTDNAGNFDMTAGIVMLNGEFMRISAVTNITYTKYIVPSAAVADNRTFAGGLTHDVMQTKGAELSAIAPAGGPGAQYVRIAGLSDVEDRRLLTQEKVRIVQIGAWNMDTTSTVTVNLGIKEADIRQITVTIRDNAGTLHDIVGQGALLGTSALRQAGFSSVGDTGGFCDLVLTRVTAGTFDDATFNGAGNRGWVRVSYV